MRIAMSAMLLVGCTLATDLDGQDCETDLDCGAGRTCSANNLCLLTSKARECVRVEQCGVGELCTSGMCQVEETARWGCVENMPEVPMSGSDKVTLRMQLVMGTAFASATPADVVTAVACALPTCEEMEGPFAPNEAGVVEVIVDQGFEGFVRLTGEGLMDTFYQLQTPLSADLSAAAEVTMLSASDVSKIAQAAGAQVNLSERGVVLFQLQDCVGDLTRDVSVADLTQDPEVDIVYLASDQSADSSASATSAAGLAMALDASIGSPEFRLTRHTSNAELGSLAVTTVAGAITYVPYQLGR